MKKTKLRLLCLSAVVSVMLIIPVQGSDAAPSTSKQGSEVLVQRVDNNGLIRLKIYIDARPAGSLRIGETATYRVKNGPHTIRAAFEDFQQRGTEITQFNSFNTRHMFTITDESIVAVGQESLVESYESPAPPPSIPIEQTPQQTSVSQAYPALPELSEPVFTFDTSVRNSFEKATKGLKKKMKIAVINVDADNPHEGVYVLEEITYLSVQSPNKYQVIDRRKIDAFRTQNSLHTPTYENDFQLLGLGSLLGADVVLSARIDGPGDLRRLRIKVLDVKTGMLIGDSSERI
ncbi:MAG: hypothetical protein Ta2G_06300 [Termitinemataceae bacterium]|nr:MAG: hypothetical protein Ta2G_06300 [Termitinemataceae bacterium]